MRGKIFILAILIACGARRTCLGNHHATPFAPRHLNLALGTISSLSASPGTISFQATNPDAVTVSGSSPGSLSWFVTGGLHTQNWSLSLQSGSSSFSGCPTIPISALRVSCSAAGVSGGSGTGACGSSFPLSTVSQQIASGAEGDGTKIYSVTLNFTLAESWRYVANSSCTVTITYTVNAP